MPTKPVADPAPSPEKDPATDNPEQPSTSGANTGERKRIPLATIPATICVGLLIAALYLGGRIIAARRPDKPVPVVHTAAPAVIPPLPTAAKPAPEPLPEPAPTNSQPVVESARSSTTTKPVQQDPPAGDPLPMIQPHAGERYIQVGALDQDATRRFLERLRGENLDPHVAPASIPDLLRVLIGPFTDIQALNEKKAQLQSEGIDTFVREY